jgi:hypothetical protein
VNSPRRSIPGLEATLASLAALPEEQKVDALVHILTEALLRMPATTLRKKRARFLEHFSRCGCSFEVCCAVQDLVDVRLAQCDRRKAGTGRRRGQNPGDRQLRCPRLPD